jgi:hypothetical protein
VTLGPRPQAHSRRNADSSLISAGFAGRAGTGQAARSHQRRLELEGGGGDGRPPPSVGRNPDPASVPTGSILPATGPTTIRRVTRRDRTGTQPPGQVRFLSRRAVRQRCDVPETILPGTAGAGRRKLGRSPAVASDANGAASLNATPPSGLAPAILRRPCQSPEACYGLHGLEGAVQAASRRSVPGPCEGGPSWLMWVPPEYFKVHAMIWPT